MGPTKGLNVIHLFCHAQTEVDRERVHDAVAWATEQGLQVVVAAIVGAKADVCFMVLGSDLWDRSEEHTSESSH